MIKKTIFLASSSELREDRIEFVNFIGQQNNNWILDKGVYFKVILWEDSFLHSMTQHGSQTLYNEAARECDIFVMLYYTKVGKYTEEEFGQVFKQFKKTKKPFIFVYFKDAEYKGKLANLNTEDLESMKRFQEKLKKLGHICPPYENIHDLKHQFSDQLTKIVSLFVGSQKLIASPDDDKINIRNDDLNVINMPNDATNNEEIIKFREEMEALKRIPYTVHNINHIYRNSMAKNDCAYKATLQTICTEILDMYRILIGGNCAVTIYLLNNKKFVETFIRVPGGDPRNTGSVDNEYPIGQDKHTAFDKILMNNTDGSTLPPHFFSANLEKEDNYKSQRENYLNYYKSQLVVPIRYKENAKHNADVIGFLGVDTMHINRLNNNYHLQLLFAFADQMYSFIRRNEISLNE